MAISLYCSSITDRQIATNICTCHDTYRVQRFVAITTLKVEQLERLRFEDTRRRLMITHTIESHWIPIQKLQI